MSDSSRRSVLQALRRVRPDEVYNLAGQSSVALSFDQPVETLESISVGTLNLLEAVRFTERPIRFYNAGSGECFGAADINFASANPSLARERLGWSARAQMHDVVRMMVAAELAEQAS